MNLLPNLLSGFVATTTCAALPETPTCTPFPSSMIEFSSQFQQPEPPLLRSEFNTSFIQHKWDENLSHITSGYIYNSPAQSLVRVDQAHDGGFGSSVFNYANISSEGLVDNTLTTFHSGSLKPDVWRGYVQPGFPLFAGDILVQAGAAFSGLVRRDLTEGLVASWSIMYHGAIPVTVYVDACDIVVGYDVFSPNLRTRVVTIFFNIRASRR